MDDQQGDDAWVDPVDPVSREFMTAYDEWSDERRAVAVGGQPRKNLATLRRDLNLAYGRLPPVVIQKDADPPRVVKPSYWIQPGRGRKLTGGGRGGS